MVTTDAEQIASVSVALLTKNGGDLLKRLLDALRNQSTDRRIEYVAIDSGSTDGTVQELENAGFHVQSIPAAEFNFGSTRQRVFELTSNRYIVNVSQDAIPAHDRWLEHLVAPLDKNQNIAVSTGRSVPDDQRTFSQFPWERNGYFYFTKEMRLFKRAARKRHFIRQFRHSSQHLVCFGASAHRTGRRSAVPNRRPGRRIRDGVSGGRAGSSPP